MKGILGRVEWSEVSPLSGSEKIIYFRHSPLCSEPSHWSLRAGSCSRIWLPQRDCDHIDKSFNMPYLPWLGGLSSDGFKSQVWVWSLKSLTHPHPEKLHLKKNMSQGKNWGHEKGATEDEMVGCHHRLNGQELEHAPGDSEGQGSLVCCSPRGRKESDMT